MINHLKYRNYDVNLYKNHVIDEENHVLTVYLNNLIGQFVGFQQYRSNVHNKRMNDPRNSRYFTYSQKKTNACWGLETFDNYKKDVYIVEGIFKASALHRLGLNSIAVLSNNPVEMMKWLFTMNYNYIAIGDNDSAGAKLVRCVGKGVQLEKDVDEYELSDLKSIIHSLEF